MNLDPYLRDIAREIAPYLFLLFGIVSRIFVPWLIARREDPTLSWTWRYVWPQLVSVLVIVLLLPLLLSDLDKTGELPLTAAYLTGWAAADIGRQTDKFFTNSKSNVIGRRGQSL